MNGSGGAKRHSAKAVKDFMRVSRDQGLPLDYDRDERLTVASRPRLPERLRPSTTRPVSRCDQRRACCRNRHRSAAHPLQGKRQARRRDSVRRIEEPVASHRNICVRVARLRQHVRARTVECAGKRRGHPASRQSKCLHPPCADRSAEHDTAAVDHQRMARLVERAERGKGQHRRRKGRCRREAWQR